MATRRWSAACAALMIASSLVVNGCSRDDPAAAEPRSPSGPRVFDGTIEEYTALERACYDEKGLATEDLPSGDPEHGQGFTYSNAGRTFEEIEAIDEECKAEIGVPRMQGLSQAQLRERYDARVEQWTCLVGKGLVTGDPLSFETFVDKYERSGQKVLWEPTEGAAEVAADGREIAATDECPRLGMW